MAHPAQVAALIKSAQQSVQAVRKEVGPGSSGVEASGGRENSIRPS